MQAGAPAAGVYLAAGQEEHDEPPVSEVVPLLQNRQGLVGSEMFMNDPAGHLLHAEAPCPEV